MQNTLLDLAILALLLSLFGSVDRVAYDRRLRLWFAGWIAIFLHLLLHAWTSPGLAQTIIRDSLHFDLLTLAGLCFLLSFTPNAPRRESFLLLLRLIAPAALLIFLVLAHPAELWAIRLTIVVGQTIAIVEIRRLLTPARKRFGIVAQIASFAAAAFMLLASSPIVQIIPFIILTQTFLLAAMVFWSIYAVRRTRGVLVATAGLFLWAVVFPLRVPLQHRSPLHAESPVLWDLWDIPMFIAAFGMILVVLEDKSRHAAVRAEEYHNLFHCHPLPMYVYSLETLRFLHVNECAIHTYGYTADEFAAMTILDIRPPEEIPRLRKVLEAERRDLNITHGWRHTLKNGRIIEVDIYRHSTRFNGQRANMIVALDVTQRNAAEQSSRQAYKIESLGQLTGGIAHDFNNLLTILTTSLELIAQQDLDLPSKTLVHDAIHSVHTGVSLTRRLLTYASQQPLQNETVRIDRLLDGMAAFVKVSIGAAIALEVASQPDLWRSIIDPHQLESALLNLSLNARDAMPRGGSLKIDARNHHVDHNQSGPLGEISTGDYVLISITDTGTGMPEHVLSRATEPFYTTKPIGEGTGLGLSMVYGFLRQSGGSLQIESKLNVGTTIFLYLPRVTAVTDLVALPPDIATAPIPRGNEIILLVEDEPTIRHVVGLLLRSLGYTVLAAPDGPSAIDHLKTVPGISLLFTDVVLPAGLDGLAIAAAAHDLQPAINVLYSSGYTRDILVRENRIPGDANLLTKPYHIAALAQQVRLALTQSDVQSDSYTDPLTQMASPSQASLPETLPSGI